jgi:hypothetical protein
LWDTIPNNSNDTNNNNNKNNFDEKNFLSDFEKETKLINNFENSWENNDENIISK